MEKPPKKPRKKRELAEANEYGLTVKESKFVDCHMIGMSSIDSVKEAGYKPRSRNSDCVMAHRLLKMPKIAAEIKRRGQITAQKTGVTREEIVGRLRKVIRCGLQEEPILDKEGE